jgi:hypothetical protein
MEYVGELTLIGIDDEEGKLDFSSSVPGDVRVMHQTLSWEGEESWTIGDPAGAAHVSVIIGRGGIAICHVVFVLNSEDTIVAHGVLPVASGTGVGNGLLAVTGGTGNYDSVGGRVDVEVVNPKKYHIITTSPGG